MEWEIIRLLAVALQDEGEFQLSVVEEQDLILALQRFFATLSPEAQTEITREIKRFAWVPLEGDLFQWEYNSRSGRA